MDPAVSAHSHLPLLADCKFWSLNPAPFRLFAAGRLPGANGGEARHLAGHCLRCATYQGQQTRSAGMGGLRGNPLYRRRQGPFALVWQVTPPSSTPYLLWQPPPRPAPPPGGKKRKRACEETPENKGVRPLLNGSIPVEQFVQTLEKVSGQAWRAGELMGWKSVLYPMSPTNSHCFLASTASATSR